MWKYYNPNPAGRIVGDCTIRAVAKALGTDWDTAATYLFVASFQMKDVQNANSAVASVLLQNGFRRDVLPDTCSGCTTFEDYVRENQNGTHVLCAGRTVQAQVGSDHATRGAGLNPLTFPLAFCRNFSVPNVTHSWQNNRKTDASKKPKTV